MNLPTLPGDPSEQLPDGRSHEGLRSQPNPRERVAESVADVLAHVNDVPKLSPSEVESDLFRLHRKFQLEMDPAVFEYFQNAELYHLLRIATSCDDAAMASHIGNTSRFNGLVGDERLYGGVAVVAHWVHENGTVRMEEAGKRIDLEYVREKGIDPSKVLFFRVTQPGGPKPEYYWTSDLFETLNGLRQEISPEKRKTSIVLVASLERINGNGWLMRDANDDNGLAVRQLGTENFPQSETLGVLRAKNA